MLKISFPVSLMAAALALAFPSLSSAQDSPDLAANFAANTLENTAQSTQKSIDTQKKELPKATAVVTPAQSPTQTKANDNPTQKVQVKGNREYDARRFDTASKIVVTQEEIARFGDTEITDVLKRLPSVSVVGGAIRMRGLGAGYTQVLLNGEPSPPGFSIESLAPDLIERIEIVRSASAEFSAQAVAGTINIILKRSISMTQRQFKLGYFQRGDLPSGLYSSFQLSDKVEQFSYSVPLNLNIGRFNNHDNQSLTRKTDSQGELTQLRTNSSANDNRNRSVSSAPRLNWTLDNEDILSFNAFINFNENEGSNRGKTNSLAGVAYRFPTEDYDTTNESQSWNNNFSWTHKLGDSAKLELRAGTHYWHSKSTGRSVGRDVYETALFDRHVDTESFNRGWTHSGKYNAPFIEDHTISAGWELASRWQSSNNLTRGTTAMNEVISPINLQEDVEFKIARSSLYAQDEWTLDKQLSVYLGLRWESITMDGRGNSLDNVHNRSAVLSPIFQTLYKIPDHPNQQIRFALSRTYKGVNSWDLVHRRYYSTNNSATSPDGLANPNLQPELATGFDLGYEHFVDGGGVFSANFFLRRISGITLNRLFQQDNLWVSMPVNGGHAQTKGLELEAKFPMRLWMEHAPALDFRMNAAMNHSTIDTVPGPNNRLDSQVPVRANIGLDYKPDALPLTVGAGYAFQNAGLVRISVNQVNYGRVNRSLETYALWKFDTMSNLRLSMNNVIRQTAYSESEYTDEQGSTLRQNYNPSKLNVRLNYEMRF